MRNRRLCVVLGMKEHAMKIERKTMKVVALVGAAVVCVALSACNTVSGVGKDIQEASDNVKNAIEN